ncbi:hypothetical protein KJ781_01630 [Patescibacteria group bacterium]|nr:hypothetical protein [Patescibacteria group bacterium]
MRPHLFAVLVVALFAIPVLAQELEWIRQIGTVGSEQAIAAAPDASGGLSVAGLTTGDLAAPNVGYHDAWLARYDSAGTQIWIRQFGTGLSEDAAAAAPDMVGGVYVGGHTAGSLGGPLVGLFDAWVARYDDAGNQIWIRQLGTAAIDTLRAAATDGSGGVYVFGDTQGTLGGSTAGNYDTWLARYDDAGNRLWIHQLGSSDEDHGKAAASDGSGGVFIGGKTPGGLAGTNPTSPKSEAWLARYDGAGNQLWIHQFGTDLDDEVWGLAPDGQGGVFLSGSSQGDLGGTNPNFGTYDAWVARYDSAGNQTWIRQFGTGLDDLVRGRQPMVPAASMSTEVLSVT